MPCRLSFLLWLGIFGLGCRSAGPATAPVADGDTVKLLEEDQHDPSLSVLLALVRVFDLCSVEELIGESRLGSAVVLAHPHFRRGQGAPFIP